MWGISALSGISSMFPLFFTHGKSESISALYRKKANNIKQNKKNKQKEKMIILN